MRRNIDDEAMDEADVNSDAQSEFSDMSSQMSLAQSFTGSALSLVKNHKVTEKEFCLFAPELLNHIFLL